MATSGGAIKRHALLLGLVVVALGVRPGADLAAAQDASPVPGTDECRVAPRGLDVQLPVPATPEVAASPSSRLPPNAVGWLEIDPAVADRVKATVREFIACRNAGDAGRAAALLSEAHLRRLAEGIGGIEALVGPVSATPAPVPLGRRFALRSVEDFGRTVDGRIGAVVVVDGPSASAPETVGRALYLFVEADGRYLIDDVIPLDGRG